MLFSCACRAESKETETSSEMRGAMMALRPPGGELGGANGDSQVPMDQVGPCQRPAYSTLLVQL